MPHLLSFLLQGLVLYNLLLFSITCGGLLFGRKTSIIQVARVPFFCSFSGLCLAYWEYDLFHYQQLLICLNDFLIISFSVGL
jgi:hypothetical protein